MMVLLENEGTLSGMDTQPLIAVKNKIRTVSTLNQSGSKSVQRGTSACANSHLLKLPLPHVYRPQTKLRKGCVCDSVHRRGVGIPACIAGLQAHTQGGS